MIITALYMAYVVLSSQYLTNKPPQPSGLPKIEEQIPTPDRGEVIRYEKYKITSYDLSFESCGKKTTNPDYGITSTGFDLTGKSIADGDRYIAVNPESIPYGSKVEIIFVDETYEKYNGIYEAVDTGAAIKKYNRIDIFIGDFQSNKESEEVKNFGITEAFVRVLPVDNQ